MASTKKRKLETGKAAFDRAFKARIKREFGREDPVQWLAEQTRQSVNTTSRILNHRLPRENSAGRLHGSWLRVQQHLTEEEVNMLAGVPYLP